MIKKYLLDVSVLVALTSDEHEHHREAYRWHGSLESEEWGVCPLTEAGYFRLVTNPATRLGKGDLTMAAAVLIDLARHPGYRYWPIAESWTALTAPFSARIFGHQQVTDAYLLGLAIKADGVLVTFDRGLKYMAGPEYARNLLIL